MPPRKRPVGDEEYGKLLRRERKRARLTQEQLAQALGFSKRDIIIDIERGKIKFFPDEEKKVNEYLQALQQREDIDRPILQQGPRLSFPELKARYREETNWVDAENGVPYIAVFPAMNEPLKLLTRKQVRSGRLHPEQYLVSPAKLSGKLFELIIASYHMLSPDTVLYAGTKKARLIKAVYDNKKSTLRVEYAPASYYDNLVTHRLLDYQLLPTDEKPLETPTRLRDILEPNSPDGFLPPLGLLSPLANTVAGAVSSSRRIIISSS